MTSLMTMTRGFPERSHSFLTPSSFDPCRRCALCHPHPPRHKPHIKRRVIYAQSHHRLPPSIQPVIRRSKSMTLMLVFPYAPTAQLRSSKFLICVVSYTTVQPFTRSLQTPADSTQLAQSIPQDPILLRHSRSRFMKTLSGLSTPTPFLLTLRSPKIASSNCTRRCSQCVDYMEQSADCAIQEQTHPWFRAMRQCSRIKLRYDIQ